MKRSAVALENCVVDVKKWNPIEKSPDSFFTYVDIASINPKTKTIETPSTIRGISAPSRARQLLAKGDVLVSTVRPNLNAVAITPEELDGATASTGFCVLRANPEKLLSTYLYHWVKTPEFVSSMTKQATGQSYPAVSDKIVKNSILSLPPIGEQKRIAAILDQADAVLRLRQRAIDRLNTLGLSIFYEMFGDPRTNPKEWHKLKLSELGTLDRGVSKHRPRNAPFLLNGPYPLIQTGDVSRSKDYITAYNATYSEKGLSQSKMWPKGTLCITIAANIADTAILNFEACFPDSVVGFSSDSDATTFFVHRWFQIMRDDLDKAAPAVAQKNINLKILRELQIILPPKVLIERFYAKQKKLINQLNMSHSYLDKSYSFFLSLQQRAFRGEL